MSDNQRTDFDAIAYWNKRYETVDASRSGHIDLPAEYNKWLYRRKQDHIAKAFSRIGASLHGTNLLEIASGSGAYMDFWAGQGVANYSGIDLSERAVESLRQRYPGRRFLQFDLNNSGLASEVGTQFGCVAAIDVLYHVTDDGKFAAALKEIASVLSPGGLLINHEQFLHVPERNHGYLKWRTLDHYLAVLDAAGFDVLYRRPTFFFMIQPVDVAGFKATVMNALWNRMTGPIVERLPDLAGAIGYAVDSAVCSVLQEGPSMEVMICRKRG